MSFTPRPRAPAISTDPTRSGLPAWTFLKNFARNPTAVGAIAPSSQGLVDTMVDWFDWDELRGVVEFGPGTGVFTEGITQRLHPDAAFFAIERSPDLAALTRARCPATTVHEASAAEVQRLCQSEGMQQVDAIICGLPWASFPESLQAGILDATLDVLRPGGRFATFAYWQGVALPAGRRFSKRLRSSFSDVHRSPTVWRNLPPAFVYRCTK
ncbi:class I SAM-dependent methyltransferase [Allorhodopirellula solitaria]|uniref:Methyltransferase domain protein n=1 Tax=Allorhodopirellula solitaria TaxID=2527987 RepID=A0A5C5XTH1_9BACT|nr:methyltransferase domain-containing protein [Allorhodopirellula solitaria]TWT65315.1 Methyltransferase domain protein [Allorhodopirellula solitaria]